jgi:hypothetical protein
MSEKIKVTPSQRQLIVSWEKELANTQQLITATLNELMLFRLEKIAGELGIDLDSEQWTFDFQEHAFVKVDRPKEVTKAIPGRKNKKVTDVGQEVFDAEVVDDDGKELVPVKESDEETTH